MSSVSIRVFFGSLSDTARAIKPLARFKRRSGIKQIVE